jgi:hypothetical protein
MQQSRTVGGTSSASINTPPRWGRWAVAGLLGVVGLVSSAAGADMYKPSKAVAGGLDPRSTITSMVQTQGTASLTWDGFMKPFAVQQASSLSAPSWQTILTTLDKQATVPAADGVGFLRVVTPFDNDTSKADPALYVGAEQCGGCHNDPEGVHAKWSKTRHAGAFETLRAIGQQTNSFCLPCHTVGYGIPGGFESEGNTWWLEGVQCENCHGPGGRHAAAPDDLSVRPQITIAAEVCGGCHTGFHHPTYDEWKEAGHSTVTEAGMFDSGAGRMYQCGVCHSGAVRRVVVDDYNEGGDGSNIVPPSINDANTYAQVCNTCHDPHTKFENTIPGIGIPAQPHQLRNPISSMKFMSYFTSTSPTNFAAQYDPNIQMCGQCHNERGAVWTGTGRPPHHSPQYNILIGQAVDPRYDTNTLGGQLIPFNTEPGGHGDPTQAIPYGNPLQCTACHNRAEEQASPTPANPNYTGHKFEVQFLACAECHGFLDKPDAEAFAEEVAWYYIQQPTQDRMALVIGALDSWATNKITDLYVPGSTNYVAFIGTNSPASVVPWEFGTIGQLNTGKNSPPAAGQSRITKYAPDILKARFLLYLVEHDASYGVHNRNYVWYLLDTAKTLAEQAGTIPAN